LTTVLFVFPPERPVTSENMNYAVAAFGVILLISGMTWIFDGRKNYSGPRLDVEGLVAGKTEGFEPVLEVQHDSETALEAQKKSD
jgi:choline transport protein